MRAAIVASREAEAVCRAAGCEVRVVPAGGGGAALEEQSRVGAEVLVLDARSGPGLGAAVLRYRLARRDTRIVLLAPGAVPGDPAVAGVVQAGVWDVCTDLAAVESVLAGPPADFAAAAKWLDPTLAPGAAPAVARVVERVVREPMPSHPVLVSVVGLAGGVGATVLSATIAGWLVRHRQSVALCGDGGLLMADGMRGEVGEDGRPAVLRGDAARAALAKRRWAWIVVDGQYDGADVAIALIPHESWRYRALPEIASLEGGVRLAARWAPRHGVADALGLPVLPVPDLAGALRAGWPVGGLVADARIDRSVRALLAPVADHLGGGRGGRTVVG